MDKIKVGAVSYLNTKPLLFGIKQSSLIDEIELIEDYPSRIADLLLTNKIDIGLVPVALLNSLKEYYIISDYCIGSLKEVASVALFFECNFNDVDTVLLDYQSKTSVALAKILFKHFWKKDVAFINADENYIDKINDKTAGLIIGDRALICLDKFSFNIDLAKAWYEFTGLPFVFATWVSNKKLNEDFINKFNKANKLGIDNLDEAIKNIEFEDYDLNEYFTKNVSFDFDDEKKKALDLFLKLMKEL